MDMIEERYIKIYFYEAEQMPPLVLVSEDGENIGYQVTQFQPVQLKAFCGKRTILVPFERIKFVDMNL